MYIETRFFDNGRAVAKLCSNRPEQVTTDKYDSYVESIGENQDYRSIEKWLENMLIEPEEIIDDLKSGNWVDITAYC